MRVSVLFSLPFPLGCTPHSCSHLPQGVLVGGPIRSDLPLQPWISIQLLHSLPLWRLQSPLCLLLLLLRLLLAQPKTVTCAQDVTPISPGAPAVGNTALQLQLTTQWPLQPLLTPLSSNNLHLYLHLHLHFNLQLSSHQRKPLQPPPQVHNQVLFRLSRWPGLLVGVVLWKGARSTAPPLKASLTWLPYVGSTWTTTRSVPCRVPFLLSSCISTG